MVQKLVLVEPEHARFLKAYALYRGLSASQLIRTLLDDVMAGEEENFVKEHYDYIFKG